MSPANIVSIRAIEGKFSVHKFLAQYLRHEIRRKSSDISATISNFEIQFSAGLETLMARICYKFQLNRSKKCLFLGWKVLKISVSVLKGLNST